MNFTMDHNSVKNVVELHHLFGAHHLIMFYICTKFCLSNPKDFWGTEPNSRVNARVVANVDRRTNRGKTGSLYGAMPEACGTMNYFP